MSDDDNDDEPEAFAANKATVQVLRLVRELANEARRLRAMGSDITRMQSLVSSQTAVELIVRLGYETLLPAKKQKKDTKEKPPQRDDNISALEGPLFEWTSRRGFRRPQGMTQLRNARNAVAHWGSVPSEQDLLRFVELAGDLVRGLSRAIWDVDIDRITNVDLVTSLLWQIYLSNADSLLRDPNFEPIGDHGFPIGDKLGKLDGGRRELLVVGLARKVWEQTIEAVGWTVPRLSSGFGRLDATQEWCWTEIRHTEARLRQDALALALGVPLPDVRRFANVRYRWVGSFDDSVVLPLDTTDAPTAEDARFAVDFVVDWVLRVEQHVWDADHASR